MTELEKSILGRIEFSKDLRQARSWGNWKKAESA